AKREIPLHDVVLRVRLKEASRRERARWPGEQSRRALDEDILELNLKVPNLHVVEKWCLGARGSVKAIAPNELREMILATLRDMIESNRVDDEGDGFTE